MNRNPSFIRIPLRPIARLAVLALLFLPVSAPAQVEMSVQLGFESMTTPGRYAPIRVMLSNLGEAHAARLRVIQHVGNEWRGTATIQHELTQAIPSDGRYESAIPVYDPVNPITVELVSSTGHILASQDLDLRYTMQTSHYPVIDRRIARFDASAAVIDVATLPTQWWALDSAESLWVASPLSSKVWSSVSQWLLAGGSLVLLTGTDFYRMDSQGLRDVLPLEDPFLAQTDRGTAFLSGARGDASVVLLSEEGFPLLVQAPYGAGHVSLVTLDARSLSTETLSAIRAHVAPSRLVSLQDATEAMLGRWTVSTLSHLVVVGMVCVLVAHSLLCVALGRHRPRVAWSVFILGIAGLSVTAGLISNPATRMIDIYALNTHLYVSTSVGVHAVYTSLYSETDIAFAYDHPEGVIPAQDLPRTLPGPDSFDLATSAGESRLRVLPGQMRTWHAYAASSPALTLTLQTGSMGRIANHTGFVFDACWVVTAGTAYPVQGIRSGYTDVLLAPDTAIRLSALVNAAPASGEPPGLPLVRLLLHLFPVQDGAWIIATAHTEHVTTAGTTQKVRDIIVMLAQGEEVGREI